MTHTERIDLRLPRATRDLIERAAAIDDVSLSAFIIDSAEYAAEQVIAEHETLTEAALTQKAFVAALLRDF